MCLQGNVFSGQAMCVFNELNLRLTGCVAIVIHVVRHLCSSSHLSDVPFVRHPSCPTAENFSIVKVCVKVLESKKIGLSYSWNVIRVSESWDVITLWNNLKHCQVVKQMLYRNNGLSDLWYMKQVTDKQEVQFGCPKIYENVEQQQCRTSRMYEKIQPPSLPLPPWKGGYPRGRNSYNRSLSGGEPLVCL